MRDYNDWEDYHQLRQLVMLKGRTAMEAVRLTERLGWMHKKREVAFNKHAPYVYDKLSSREQDKSTLACIVAPDHPELERIPPYWRYVAYVISEGVRQAPARLGTSRMSLYRWILKNKFVPTFRVETDTKRRAYKPKGKSSHGISDKS